MRLNLLLGLSPSARVMLVSIAGAAALVIMALFALIPAALAVPSIPSVPMAAQVTRTTIDFGPIASAVIEFAAPTIISVGGVLGLWVLQRLANFLGLKIDQRRADSLDQGIQKGIGLAVSKLEDRAMGGIPIDVKSEAIAIASGYATRAVPGAVKHFKKTSDDIADMVESRLQGLLIGPITTEVIDPLGRPLRSGIAS